MPAQLADCRAFRLVPAMPGCLEAFFPSRSGRYNESLWELGNHADEYSGERLKMNLAKDIASAFP